MNRLSVAALALAVLLAPLAAAADDVAGIWQTQTSENGAYLHVRIAPCGYDTSKTCGQIVEAVNAQNPEIVGRAIITGMQPNGDGRWNKGQIWAPDDDKTYRSSMELSEGNLNVNGCVAFICRGQIWTRVN